MRTTFFLAALAARLTIPPLHPPDELRQLNDCIQKRFQDRKAFGMQRVIPNQFHGLRQFRPENAAEQAVIAKLEQQGYEVALYLSGRNVLTIPSLAPSLPPYRFAVQGPAYLTHIRNTGEIPPSDALFDESRAALASFATGEGYDLRKGEWTVAMRPLRASNEACIQCHNSYGAHVKMNDALGVAMYVYRHN
jgi:hypothetical protein